MAKSLNRLIQEYKQLYPSPKGINGHLNGYSIYLQEDNIQIVFESVGCSKSCTMCDWGTAYTINQTKIKKIFKKILNNKKNNNFKRLIIGSLGSILDENEFPRENLIVVLEELQKTHFEIIYFETFYDTITKERLELINKYLPNRTIYFEMGIESFNKTVLNKYLNKHINFVELKTVIQNIKSFGNKVAINLIMGIPFLTTKENKNSVLDSIKEANEYGADEIVLFPINIRPHTILYLISELKLYSPISHWAVIDILSNLSGELLDKIFLSWYGDRELAYDMGKTIMPIDCEKCHIALQSFYKTFNTTYDIKNRISLVQNLLNNVSCACYEKYIADLNSNIIPVHLEKSCKILEIELEKRKAENHLYWFGIRESEIEDCKHLFKKTFSVFGSNKGNNISLNNKLNKNINHNTLNNEPIISDFYISNINKIVKEDKQANFYSYNQQHVYGENKDYERKSICLNSQKLLEFLNNKFECKKHFGNVVPILEHTFLNKKEIQELDLSVDYVIQNQVSCGGDGTYLYNMQTEKKVKRYLKNNTTYLVTKYVKNNIPINVHLLISKKQVIVLPPSIQIIELESNKLAYKGCDYISYNSIDNKIKDKVIDYSTKIGKDLQISGYLGVCGIDFIIVGNEVYFMEINARFQNSTTLLNRGLIESKQKTLHELNILCFENKYIEIKPFAVNYASYILTNNKSDTSISTVPVEIFDNKKKEVEYEKDSYIHTLVYNCPIVLNGSNI